MGQPDEEADLKISHNTIERFGRYFRVVKSFHQKKKKQRVYSIYRYQNF